MFVCTLRRWYSTIEGKPGFTKEALRTLKLRKESAKEKKRYLARILFFISIPVTPMILIPLDFNLVNGYLDEAVASSSIKINYKANGSSLLKVNDGGSNPKSIEYLSRKNCLMSSQLKHFVRLSARQKPHLTICIEKIARRLHETKIY
ncbi:hypothetical protein EVAR_59929_1 [Eumeta japonica]|uniref:Uncharacterized protein n=1 Tax=Eumeta variegata TaxID=151549 RepID=A0A4C1YV37_EUMVA|nr:hypothetical protein EVAR_59929_1 [Eumeta japonica]